MKKKINFKVFLPFILLMVSLCACKKSTQGNAGQYNITQVNLVADTAGFGAARIDTNLLNAWGIAAIPSGPIWVASNHHGSSVVYNQTGNTLINPVNVPSSTPGQLGAPSGIVYNSTTDFAGNKFIFASEDGIIAAWGSGPSARIVIDRSQTGTVYKGITIGQDGGANFIYATNFRGGKIDVFDKNFSYVTTKPFVDASIPAGFGPFNIQNIGGQLYVTYAKLKAPDNMDDQAGAGNGYVDVFNTNGTLVKRFASQGTLNSPWGIALAPAGFASNQTNILIGNFGDGRINVFDTQGNYIGQLQNSGKPVVVAGLWAIDFLNNNVAGINPNTPLYFSAGPDGEAHGLFGYLQSSIPVTSQSTNSGGY